MRNDSNQPYQTDDSPPTLTFRKSGLTLALPYHSLRSMQLGEGGDTIRIGYAGHEATVSGANLDRLWRELCAYRVSEIAIDGGAAAKVLGSESGRCLVDAIAVVAREDGEDSPQAG